MHASSPIIWQNWCECHCKRWSWRTASKTMTVHRLTQGELEVVHIKSAKCMIVGPTCCCEYHCKRWSQTKLEYRTITVYCIMLLECSHFTSEQTAWAFTHSLGNGDVNAIAEDETQLVQPWRAGVAYQNKMHKSSSTIELSCWKCHCRRSSWSTNSITMSITTIYVVMSYWKLKRKIKTKMHIINVPTLWAILLDMPLQNINWSTTSATLSV